MKKFTIKDFIKYNGPCFNCGETINFRVLVDNSTNMRPNFGPDHFSIDLSIKYSRSLQIWLFYKTNKIVTSDPKELSIYLKEHELRLKSYCDRCYSNVESQPLEFDLENSFVKPVGIQSELFNIEDDKYFYNINTLNKDAYSGTIVTLTSLNKKATSTPSSLVLPLLPLYKFQTKEKLINKIKTYLVFS